MTFVVHVELVGPAVDAEALIFLVFGVNRQPSPGVFGRMELLIVLERLRLLPALEERKTVGKTLD